MSGLVRRYTKILRHELQCRPVWLPILTQAEVGDYGVISGGTFHRVGNLASDFADIPLDISEGPPSTLNFVSSSARIVRVAGGVEVPAFAAGAAGDGRLEINFSAADSLLLKSREVTKRRLGNINRVAQALSTTHRKDWRFLGHVIVSEVLVGHDVVFLSTRSADTKVTFAGSVQALQAVDALGARADVSVAWNREVGLDMVGKTGAIGLNLFRVRWATGGVVMRSGKPKTGKPGEPKPADKPIIEWQDPGETLEDTL